MICSLILLLLLIFGNILATDNSQQPNQQPIPEQDKALSPVTAFSISGKVTQQFDGKPIANIKIDLFDENWQFLFDKFIFTDAEGKYTVSNLAQGSYYLLATGVSLDTLGRYKGMYISEYYKESKDRAGALLVNLSGNLTDIDFTLEGACISGFVTHQATGLPIINMFMTLFDSSWNNIGENYPHRSMSAPDGTYYFGALPPGTYYVQAAGETSDQLSYIPEYYKESRDQAGATKLKLICGDTTNINFTIEDWGRISGKVTRQDNGAPIDSIHVLLFDVNWELAHWCQTGTEGQYLFNKAYPGSYFIGIEGNGFFDGKYQKRFLSEYYLESNTREGAALLNVGADALNIDFALQEGCTISGVATRQDNGSPIQNARIRLYDSHWTDLAEELTDAAGHYLFSGLENGSYYVEATGWCDVDGQSQQLFFNEYYLDAPIREAATLLNITGATSQINFTLEQGKSISGFVKRQDNNQPIASTRVILYDSQWNYLEEIATNSQGAYLFRVRSGDYFLEANGWVDCNGTFQKLFKNEFYRESPDQAGALLIHVAQDMNDVNFTLVELLVIRGKITRQQDGMPIQETQVIAYNDNWDFIQETRTNSDGIFNFAELDTSQSYYFEATGKVWWDFGTYSDWNQLYRAQFFNKTASRDSATLVDLSGAIPSIDFILHDFEGYTISGKVIRQDNSAPIGFSGIDVYDADQNQIAFTIASDSGKYITPKLAKGSYYIVASGYCESNGWWKFYKTEYYLDSPNWEEAEILSLDHNLENINFALEEAISIWGRVVRHDNSEPIPDAQIIAYDSLWGFIKEVRTNSDGFYQITDLDSSAYYVEASGRIYWNFGAYGDWKQEYVGEYYNRVRECEQSTLLNVKKSLTDVDFYLKHHTGVAEKPTNHVADRFYLFQNRPNP
ncbi:MAG: carboxypeptidase regulatory-like domain-containing protein, partial [bacterium]|nr:carboxypeptidase regulatory-like domain-containing protein [bacterium]